MNMKYNIFDWFFNRIFKNLGIHKETRMDRRNCELECTRLVSIVMRNTSATQVVEDRDYEKHLNLDYTELFFFATNF